MEAQAAAAAGAWTTFAVSVSEQVTGADTHWKMLLAPLVPASVVHACRSQTNLICALLMPTLASKGYKIYVQVVWQALLPIISWTSCWWVLHSNHAQWQSTIEILKCNMNTAGSFANSAHQALLGATQSRPYCRC